MGKSMISARIPEELDAELEAIAENTKRTKAFVVTEALEDYVDRKAWLTKRILDAETRADATGEYVDHDDIVAWLDTWGKPNELSPPAAKKR